MGFTSRAILAMSSAMVAGCGLVSGLDSLHVDGGAPDDASSDAVTSDADAAPPLCDCGPLLTGWTPIVVHAGGGCPDGYASQKYVSQPMPACGCSCAVTSPPSCTTGFVPTFYGNNCSSTGLVVSANNGNCTTFGSGTLQANFQATPAAPTGGACSPIPSVDASVTNVEACVAPCGDAICQGAAPTGFQACVIAAGSRPCPQGTPFTVATQVGTSASVTCPTCGCTSTGTCSKGTMEFFSDSTCQTPVVTLTADGVCQTTGVNGVAVQSVKYAAQANGACAVNPIDKQGTASLVDVHTVCCTP